MVRLSLLRPGSLSRTDQKQMARSRSRDRHDRGAVLACSRRARRISGRLWRWRWDGDPKSTKRHRGSEFCRELRGRTVCFCCGCGSDTAADVMIAGRRYDTFVLACAAQQPDRRRASWSWFGVFLCVASRVQSSEAELTTATSLHGLWRIGERTSLKQSGPISPILTGLPSCTPKRTADGAALRAAPPCFFSS